MASSADPADPFYSNISELISIHSQNGELITFLHAQVSGLRAENDRLSAENAELRRRDEPPPAPRGGVEHKWAHFVALATVRPALGFARQQMEKQGRFELANLVAGPSGPSVPFSAEEALQYYDAVRDGSPSRDQATQLWKRACKKLRDQIVVFLCRQADVYDRESFELEMRELAGERFDSNGGDGDFRSSFIKSYYEVFSRQSLMKPKPSRVRGSRRHRHGGAAQEEQQGQQQEQQHQHQQEQQAPEPQHTGPVKTAEASSPRHAETVEQQQGVDFSRWAQQPVYVKNTFLTVDDEQQSVISDGKESASQLHASAGLLVPAKKRKGTGRAAKLSRKAPCAESCGDAGPSVAQLQEEIEPLLAALRAHCDEEPIFQDILSALVKKQGFSFLETIQEYAADMEAGAVAQCCEFVGTFAQKNAGRANDIAQWLAQTMESHDASQAVQMAALDALLTLFRKREEVLGVVSSREGAAVDFDYALRDDVKRQVTMAMKQYEDCRGTGIKILARSQTLSVLLDEVATLDSSPEIFGKALNEIFYNLEEPLKSLEQEQDEASKRWGRELLCKISSQRVEDREKPPTIKWVSNVWAERGQAHEERYRHFELVGLLFGSGSEIVKPLKSAEETHNQPLISAALRAMIYLNDYVDAMPQHRAQVVDCVVRVVKSSKELSATTLSCMVGAIGSLMRGAACEEGSLDDGLLLDKAMDGIESCILMQTKQHSSWWRSTFFHEAMWALAEIFKDAQSLHRFDDKAQTLANNVVDLVATHWPKALEEDLERTDEGMAVIYARKVLDLAGPVS
jgi:hypothetical protein